MFGTVEKHGDYTTIRSTPEQLAAWANKPGARWPCSELARYDAPVFACFDSRGNLVDTNAEIGGAEFNAWSSDVLAGRAR
jgi:hypothetical protein